MSGCQHHNDDDNYHDRRVRAGSPHVADYFCVLGVGNKLVWKHQQKRNPCTSPHEDNDVAVRGDDHDEASGGGRSSPGGVVQEDTTTNSGNDPVMRRAEESYIMPRDGISSANDIPHPSDLEEETERFRREIVDVAIVCTYGDGDDDGDDNDCTNSEGGEGTRSELQCGSRKDFNMRSKRLTTGNRTSRDGDEVMFLRSSSSVLGNDNDDESDNDGSLQGSCNHEAIHEYGNDGRLEAERSVGETTNGASSRRPRSSRSHQPDEWIRIKQTLPLQGRRWTADLNWDHGLPAQVQGGRTNYSQAPMDGPPKFYLAYQRRSCLRKSIQNPKYYKPAISHAELRYVRIHAGCCMAPATGSQRAAVAHSNQNSRQSSSSISTWTEPWKHLYSGRTNQPSSSDAVGVNSHEARTGRESDKGWPIVQLESYLRLPNGYNEWRIPEEFKHIYDPEKVTDALRLPSPGQSSSLVDRTTVTVAASSSADDTSQSGRTRPGRSAVASSGAGFETVILETLSSHEMISESHSGLNSHPSMSVVEETSIPSHSTMHKPMPLKSEPAANSATKLATSSSKFLIPRLLNRSTRNPSHDVQLGPNGVTSSYMYIPVLAIRRQCVSDEERFHEDPAIAELSISFYSASRSLVTVDDDAFLPELVLPTDEEEDEEEMMMDMSPDDFSPLDMAEWCDASWTPKGTPFPSRDRLHAMSVVLVSRRNRPYGFADATFATSVLNRFPFSNYKDLPLPEEELPMFCYPTGCRLFRARLREAPLPEYYGFVVKNERGDSIYVSCVSFMEPLVAEKVRQLDRMSWHRLDTSLPHREYCRRKHGQAAQHSLEIGPSGFSQVVAEEMDSSFLMGFDDVTTFEKKTICLVSRYPFWTAFRKFLSHLHILSTSTSEMPLERYISHLLLVVPVPRPGGPSVIVPLPALNEPMIMSMPNEKDLPLVDIPFQRLVSCLEVKTLVTVVLGLLALERKVIVMSTRPSLVLDVCELLRALLFPFELCAPYVPRLTEPFQSSLEFPGALFVGIHKDGSPRGLAETVMENPPEDSFLVDLDSGSLDCDGDRTEVIGKIWALLPAKPRSMLISELETLCRDAGIVDGQEPLDSQYDSAFEVTLPAAVEDFGVISTSRDSFDDRAFRDAFLRFFCSVLGGYDRFLVVPDADFLVSGNEWFDAQGFLASVSAERAPYLGSLVTTQLFQSFIQRRTEASDVHCLLFDECIAEFHSASLPYGRLGGDVEVIPSSNASLSRPQIMYSLLVDQAALTPHVADHLTIVPNRSMDASEADSSINLSKTSISIADYSVRYGASTVNTNGDFITTPSQHDLQLGRRYVYTVDGNPCFPERLKRSLFLPSEPDAWYVELAKQPNPLLFRSDRELDDADRMRRKATSYRSIQNQRRCLWQLPKLMGSHFLGAWLLCIPVQVSQKSISPELQSRYLSRSLGALRLMRSKQRIVPDEAAYRALMVACGRCTSDRRVELVKLFGLLRSDGIFPSAVTLGQYTRALAEGYSKRLSSSSVLDDDDGLEVTESASRVGRLSVVSMGRRQSDVETRLTQLDSNIGILEDHGRRWRHRNGRLPGEAKACDKAKHQTKAWLPVFYSTSFAPPNTDPGASSRANAPQRIRITAMWSRTRQCNNCTYIPFDEEIQAGWDVVGGDHDIPGAIACPRCGSLIVPMLGYRTMSLAEALEIDCGVDESTEVMAADFASLPPQLRPCTSDVQHSDASVVAYVSPATLRRSLEQYVQEYGEDVLHRDTLREHDPELFVNFWWYCARFSLPLPLAVSPIDSNGNPSHHDCVVVAWDRSSAERGCLSAAKVFSSFFEPTNLPLDQDEADASPNLEWLDDPPLLSRFNLQAFHSSVWEHVDLFTILVKLVEACDKRDFKPVVEAVLSCNIRRREEYDAADDADAGSEANSAVNATRNPFARLASASDTGARSMSSLASMASTTSQLDVYRTVLYLAKYHCTTAFSAFFPSTVKPCKGYHFWCAIGSPVSMFDRLWRDAVDRIKSESGHRHPHQNARDQSVAHRGGQASQAFVPSATLPSLPDVSDVALAFRSVFGHLI